MKTVLRRLYNKLHIETVRNTLYMTTKYIRKIHILSIKKSVLDTINDKGGLGYV